MSARDLMALFVVFETQPLWDHRTPAVAPNRLREVRTLLSLVSRFITERSQNVFNQVHFINEEYFYPSRYVNSQNNRYWSSENLNRFDLIASTKNWSVSLGKKIIGLIFFYWHYQPWSVPEYFDAVHCLVGWKQNIYSNEMEREGTIEFLREFVGDRLISISLWLPRSLNLTPVDFLLYGALKGGIYNDNLPTIEEFKAAITREIVAINHATLKKVFTHMMQRARLCI